MVMMSVFLPLLLMMMKVIIPVTSRLNSVRVTSYKGLRKTKNVPVMCALDKANETMSSSSLNDCSLKTSSVHEMPPALATTSRTHSPVITSTHLYWIQHQELHYLRRVQLQADVHLSCLRLQVSSGCYHLKLFDLTWHHLFTCEIYHLMFVYTVLFFVHIPILHLIPFFRVFQVYFCSATAVLFHL